MFSAYGGFARVSYNNVVDFRIHSQATMLRLRMIICNNIIAKSKDFLLFDENYLNHTFDVWTNKYATRRIVACNKV